MKSGKPIIIKMDPEKAAAEYKAGKYKQCIALLNSNNQANTNSNSNNTIQGNIITCNTYNVALATMRLQGDTTEAAALFSKFLNLNRTEVRLGDAAVSYGRACMLYHYRKYAKALLILDRLLPLLNQIVDDELSRRIVLLTIQVHLSRGAPTEALQLAESKASMMTEASARTTDVWGRLKLKAELALGKKSPPVESGKSAAWDLLRAHQLYVNGEYHQAAAELSSMDTTDASVEVDVCRDLNLALCRAAIGNLWAGICRAQKALRSQMAAGELPVAKQYTWPRDRLLLTANLGLLLLKAERPERAFECLVETTNRKPGDPRSWLRLAECCLSADSPRNSDEPPFREIGIGPHARLVPAARPRDGNVTSEESCAVPTPSPEFASLCLVNAKVLLASPGSVDPGKLEPLKEMYKLLSCYTCLRLADPRMAIREAEGLIKEDPRIDRKILAMLYMAEAQARLGQTDEAIMTFNNCHRMASESKIPARQTILNAARVGLIACGAIAGDASKAKELLKQVDLPNCVPLRLYLEVKCCSYDSAAVLLREHGRGLVSK